MIQGLIERQAVVRLVVFMTVVFGAYTYFGYLPREASPDVKIPVVMVSTPYAGVAPKDIESLVTNPLENELAGVKDLKKMSSSSVEGASIISLEFEPEIVIEDALQQVRDRVNRAKAKLPTDAEEPSVREVSFSDVPVVIVTLAGDLDEESLKTLGDQMAEDFKRIGGVLDAKVTGGRERELKVQVDPSESRSLDWNSMISSEPYRAKTSIYQAGMFRPAMLISSCAYRGISRKRSTSKPSRLSALASARYSFGISRGL